MEIVSEQEFSAEELETTTGGRPATGAVIPGEVALSIGNPKTPTPEGWRWVRLTDVARLETGHTPSRAIPEYWGGDVPWVGVRDATENHGRTIFGTRQYTNLKGIANSSARILPANTVCLSRTASVGYVVVMGVPMATSQDFVNWVCSEALDHRYLKYVLLADTEAIRRFSYGTTHQTVYFPEVKAFHALLPPRAIQKSIADTLSSLDEKIELNRQMNQTLEEMARAIFRSWFVDFDPVRVKAAGGDPVKELGLSPEVAALFPDSFQHSELGGLPVGWSVGSILGVARLLSGGTPKTARADYWDGDVKWASAKDVSQCQSAFLIETERTITEAGLAGSATRLIPAYSTVVVARGATTGRMVMFGREMAMNQTCYALQSIGGTPFALNMLCQETMPSLVSAAHGSVFDTITTKTFENSRVVTPPQAVLTAFESLVKPLFRLVLANEVENAHLSNVRDYLLPLLLRGRAVINSRPEQDCPPMSSSDSPAVSFSSFPYEITP